MHTNTDNTQFSCIDCGPSSNGVSSSIGSLFKSNKKLLAEDVSSIGVVESRLRSGTWARILHGQVQQEENKLKAQHSGLWFVVGGFLSVVTWEPNFAPTIQTMSHTAIWVRLPQLPTEFYDHLILEKIRNYLGSLLKIDSCTSVTLRGTYARLCIQIPLGHLVKQTVIIGDYTQMVEYERNGVLCVGCGRVSHTLKNCSFTPTTLDSPVASSSAAVSHTPAKSEDMWTLVRFPKKRVQTNGTPEQASHREPRECKSSRHITPSHNTPKRSAPPTQASKRSEDPQFESLGSKLDTSGDFTKDHGHKGTRNSMSRALETILPQEKMLKLTKKNSMLGEKNIPTVRNVQMNTINDKTPKFMSINVFATPGGSTNLMEDLNSSERGANGTPTAHDMTIKVTSINSNSTNHHHPSKNGKDFPNNHQPQNQQITNEKNSESDETKYLNPQESHLLGDCTPSSGLLTNILAGNATPRLPPDT
ncbi:hypothetical protein BC332_04842 [Capsicum chinense]|nr:hypothetical protein BC332_04842 [Capsicum chinense]